MRWFCRYLERKENGGLRKNWKLLKDPDNEAQRCDAATLLSNMATSPQQVRDFCALYYGIEKITNLPSRERNLAVIDMKENLEMLSLNIVKTRLLVMEMQEKIKEIDSMSSILTTETLKIRKDLESNNILKDSM